MSGEVVETPLGTHFENREAVREASAGTAAMDLLETCSSCPKRPAGRSLGDESQAVPAPARWAFLDTEKPRPGGRDGHVRVFWWAVGRHLRGRFSGAAVFHAGLRRGAEPTVGAGAGHLEDFRRPDHLQRQDLRPAAAGDALPDGPRANSLRPAWRTWTCCTARAGFGSLRFDSCRLVDLENQILASSARAICPAKMIPLRSTSSICARSRLSGWSPSSHHNATGHSKPGLPDRHRGRSPFASRGPRGFAHGKRAGRNWRAGSLKAEPPGTGAGN